MRYLRAVSRDNITPKRVQVLRFRFRQLPLMTTIGSAAFVAHRRFSSLLFSQLQLPLNPKLETPSYGSHTAAHTQELLVQQSQQRPLALASGRLCVFPVRPAAVHVQLQERPLHIAELGPRQALALGRHILPWPLGPCWHTPQQPPRRMGAGMRHATGMLDDTRHGPSLACTDWYVEGVEALHLPVDMALRP